VVLHTLQHSRTLAVNVSLNWLANNAWLAGWSWLHILSVRFCCVPVYGAPLNHESKTEFIFQSVSQANTVNMNAPALTKCYKRTRTWIRPMVSFASMGINLRVLQRGNLLNSWATISLTTRLSSSEFVLSIQSTAFAKSLPTDFETRMWFSKSSRNLLLRIKTQLFS
jgi:hypothetical protein